MSENGNRAGEGAGESVGSRFTASEFTRHLRPTQAQIRSSVAESRS
jgi:hypothetical protein